MKKYILFGITILFISCANYEETFERLVSIPQEECFPSIDTIPLEKIKHTCKAYYRLYKAGPGINAFLLEKAQSTRPTKWHVCPFPFYMTEGDTAIELLVAINNIDFYRILPEEIAGDYENSGAWAWWAYLHKNTENRNHIIALVRDSIDK